MTSSVMPTVVTLGMPSEAHVNKFHQSFCSIVIAYQLSSRDLFCNSLRYELVNRALRVPSVMVGAALV